MGGAALIYALGGCVPGGIVPAATPTLTPISPPEAGSRPVITRGLSIDRQYLRLPLVPNFDKYDIRLIKSMGFEHVKLIVNPEPHKSANGVHRASMSYLDAIVGIVLDEGLPAVVCIHPEHPFKLKVLGNWDEFEDMLGFYREFAGYIAGHWDPNQVVFQLMTEPNGNQWDWNTMQTAMWEAVRDAMPDHTLILSGDEYAVIEGLVSVDPVDDANVLYCFGFYEPYIFSFQGGQWAWEYIPYLQHVPYPSSPEIISAAMDEMLANVPEGMREQAETDLRAYGEERWNKERLAARLQKALDWAISHGNQRLWVTEWGVYHGATNPEHRYAFIQDARELFDSNGVGWAYWSFNETQTVLTPENQVDHRMLQALGLEARDG
jgi:hypothetical protein